MFHRCKNEDDIKKLFRSLALKLHPDQGGSVDHMVFLQESYEIALKQIKNPNKKEHTDSKNKSKKYQTVTDIVSDGSPELEILKEIAEYAKNNKKFNTDFVESLLEFLENNGFLTSYQYNKLVKIYYAFRMDIKK